MDQEAILNETPCDDKSETPTFEECTGHTEPLFEGSTVTKLQACFLVFQYALRHHLSSKAFSELLLLLKILLPGSNSMPKSIYLLQSFFINNFPNVKVNDQHYCRDCHTPVKLPRYQCPNSVCRCVNFDQFITMPIGSQLIQIMKGL